MEMNVYMRQMIKNKDLNRINRKYQINDHRYVVRSISNVYTQGITWHPFCELSVITYELNLFLIYGG